jgi:integrase
LANQRQVEKIKAVCCSRTEGRLHGKDEGMMGGRKFRLLEENNVRDRVLTEEEYQYLLFAAPKHLRSVLIMAWETGMRRGEILNLKWEKIDMRAGVIKLSGEQTKSGKGRTVPISPVLKTTLKSTPRISGWVFNYKGKQLRDIRTGFTRACIGGDIHDFRFHDLRHCFVTRMRRQGVPDRVIMAITGHQTLECFRRYDTISVDDLRQAVEGS